MNRNYATDVLAFDLHENGTSSARKKVTEVYGDVIISTDAAFKSIKTYDTTVEREVVLYVIHGILHLLGYDDHSPKDIKRMRKREAEFLGLLEKDISRVIPAKAGIKKK